MEGRRAAHQPPLQLLLLAVTMAHTPATALQALLLLGQRWAQVVVGARLLVAAWGTAWALPLQLPRLLHTGTPAATAGDTRTACRLQAPARQRTGEAACPRQLPVHQAGTARALQGLQAATALLLPVDGRAGQLRVRLLGQAEATVAAAATARPRAAMAACREEEHPLQGLRGTADSRLHTAATAGKLLHEAPVVGRRL